MLVDEQSVAEQLLRDLLGDLDRLPPMELQSSPASNVEPVKAVEWPSVDPGDEALAAGWSTAWNNTRSDDTDSTSPDSARADGTPENTSPADDAEWRAPGVHDTTGSGTCGARISDTADPGAEIAALSAALHAVAAQDPRSLSEGQALARTRWLLRASERIKALSVQALADVETRRLFTLDDAPTVNAWVRRLDVPGVDSSELTLSRRLRRVPQIAEEIAAGRMSTRSGATLTSAVTKVRPFLDRPDGLIDGLDGEQVLDGVLVNGVCTLVGEQIGGAADAEQRLTALRTELEHLNDPTCTQLARWEAALVVLARECDPALLPSGVALLVDALLPHEHDKRAQQAEGDRGLTLRRNGVGSGWYVKGELDDETGEMFATVLDAAAATDPANPDDTRRHADGRTVLGDDTLPPEDWPVDQTAPRSRSQQRHDAFKRGLQALLDSGVLGVRGKVAPHIGVTVSLDFVEGVPGSLPTRTDHGARFSRAQVRRLICRGTFTRLVLDARNRVVDVSHTQRTSTALERLILKTQGGAVCNGSGCARGPATGHRLIPHHVTLFSDTGRTELADTVLICEIDHDHELHDKGRNLRLKDGRVIGPHGWVRR